ncbi:MAG: hypothetical protein CMN28_09630 [Salinisphaeraceae bacterium]|nr:hypothetical protein [Salinisphaeraceae bacterium]
MTGTLNINGQQTYTGTVTAAETVGGLISIMAFPNGSPPNSWNVTVRNQTGVQVCNQDDGPLIQFSTVDISTFQSNSFTTANGNAGDCQIEITQTASPDGNSTIEGVFTATLRPGDSNADMTIRNVTRGAFRADVISD